VGILTVTDCHLLFFKRGKIHLHNLSVSLAQANAFKMHLFPKLQQKFSCNCLIIVPFATISLCSSLSLPSLDHVQCKQPSPLHFTDEAIPDVSAAVAVNGISSFCLTLVKAHSQVPVIFLGAIQDL